MPAFPKNHRDGKVVKLAGLKWRGAAETARRG